MHLPPEIWLAVFQLALAPEDSVVLTRTLPTSMEDSSWVKMLYGNWTLRTPQESVNVIQRGRYITLKVLSDSCCSSIPVLTVTLGYHSHLQGMATIVDRVSLQDPIL